MNIDSFSKLENLLKGFLPEEYKKFMLEHNGGRPIRRLAFSFMEYDPEMNESFENELDIYSFNKLEDIPFFYDNLFSSELIPEQYCPIADDSCGNEVLLCVKARDEINKAKEDFYTKYSHLKPECEKSRVEKIVDAMKSACEWCKEHWKLIATIVIVAVAVVLICTGVAAGAGAMLLGACWGAILGACIGGVAGGINSKMHGGSFLDGFEDGAFSGAIGGAIGGAAFAGLGQLGAVVGKGVKCASTLGKCIKGTAAVTKVMSTAMGGFDTIALLDKAFGNGNIAALNAKLHESKAYNFFQTGVSAVAAFTGGMSSSMTCFVAGTLVMTASGLMAIEKIKAGDRVLSADPETMQTGYKSVLETYIREVDRLIHLTVNGEEIVTTYDHPFYVKDKGFINAEQLWIGAELVDNNGNTLCIEQICREEFDNELIRVYNFKVEEYHTYFVSCYSILVHNANYPDHMTSNGQLKPDTEYKTGEHDYSYKTDGNGRIESVHADELHLKNHDGRLSHSANTPGKQSNDHAGHLIADQFDGSPKLDNVVSQDGYLNTHEYRSMERTWAKAINNGQKVTDVNIKVNYSGNSTRPSSFKVSFKIDGIKTNKTFIN